MTDADMIKALADKVMGWKYSNFKWFRSDGSHTGNDFWNPLESIADAWMLVEKITPDKTVTIHQILMDDKTIDWRVDVDDDENDFTVVVSGNSKAPRAISLAIAKAYGVSDDNR